MKTEAAGDGSRDLDTTVRKQMRVMLEGCLGGAGAGAGAWAGVTYSEPEPHIGPEFLRALPHQ